MADASGPFDGTPWAETEWYRHMPAAMKSGVIGTKVSGVANGALGWTASGRDITLTAGNANVGGAGYSRSTPLNAVSVPANSSGSLSRRDRLVLRRSLATKTVTPVVITGTAAASPVAPAITQNATTYDLKLFSFLTPPNSGTSLTSVIDERNWVSDGTVDQTIFSPFLGDTPGSSSPVTVGAAATNVVSVSVVIPEGLDEVRRIRVHGYVFCKTIAGVGLFLSLTSSAGFSVSRQINEGSLVGDYVFTRYDTNLTAGARTYNLQVQSSVNGQDVITRAPYISAEII